VSVILRAIAGVHRDLSVEALNAHPTILIGGLSDLLEQNRDARKAIFGVGIYPGDKVLANALVLPVGAHPADTCISKRALTSEFNDLLECVRGHGFTEHAIKYQGASVSEDLNHFVVPRTPITVHASHEASSGLKSFAIALCANPRAFQRQITCENGAPRGHSAHLS